MATEAELKKREAELKKREEMLNKKEADLTAKEVELNTEPTAAKKSSAPADVAALVNKKIHRHMTYAAGVGLIPIPALDMASLMTIQMALVRQIAKAHNNGSAEKMSDKRLRTVLTTLLAGISAPIIGGSVAKLFSQIPIVKIATFAVVPSFHAASTYAIGKTFDRYFDEGGDITHFNVSEQWGHFKKFYAYGRTEVSNMYKSFGTKPLTVVDGSSN